MSVIFLLRRLLFFITEYAVFVQNGPYIYNRQIMVSSAYKKDILGERHESLAGDSPSFCLVFFIAVVGHSFHVN